ncbi:UNVERIFIED_CONTAM: hypothetical protein HDU68_007869 [Siphonaria sp. JEL0065]|nr:hypothetical protein HDU68_007869 [Siphonaria sp. JEL0065]
MFGATAPAQQNTFGFGAQPQQQQQQGGLFGAAPTNAQPGFGTPATSSFGFGAAAAATPSYGAPGSTTPTNNFGTGNPQYVVSQERESAGTSSLSAGAVSNFMSISAMPNYKNWNFEELRVQDYIMGKKFSSSAPGMGGASTGFGAQQTTGFGGGGFGAAAAPAGGLFGQTQPPAQQNTGFGFGAAAAQPTTGGLFGATNNAAPSLFGGAATNTGFGATATTPAFGAAPANTGFGFGAANNAPKTGFGFGSQATTPSAFGGQPAATGFGAAPASNAFGTGAFGAQTGGGLFGGAKPTTTSPFGAANTGLGGGFGSALGANNTTGAFGAAPAATGAFGAKPATTSPFGGGANTGGLFGSAQPAAQTNPFGMGAAAPTSGGLFGAAPAATTGGFGSSLGGGFGAAKPAATGGLFGAAPAPATGGLFGGGGFGAAATPAPATGGLFGGGGFGAAATPGPATGGFGSSLGGGFGTSLGGGFGASTAPATGGSLFGGAQSTFGQSTAAPQATLQAGIDKNPYGNNPLFNASVAAKTTGTVSSGPALFAPPEAAEKKQALLPHYKMTPKSASKIKLRGFTPAKPPTDFFSGVSGGSAVVGGSGSSPAGLPKSVLGMLKDDGGDALSGANYPGAFKPRVKKLVIAEDESSNTGFSNGSTPARNAGPSTVSSANRTVRFLDESESVNVPVIDVTLSTKKPAPATFASKLSSSSASPAITPPGSNARSSSPKRSPTRSATPVYETEPSTEELMQLSDAELRRVEGYTVILPSIGKVKFLDPVDLIKASPTGTRAGIAQIPGTIVLLKHKVIEVYPDETEKDPVGMGVNVPAEVSLERCWVIDKSTGHIIDDDTDPRFDRHYKRLESIEGTKMLGFNKKTGTWRFKVEHFSKYGFDEDDEEDGDVPAAAPVAVTCSVRQPKVPVLAEEFEIEDDEEEDDEGGSFAGNDSFAYVKSRKAATGKVGDLRKVAFLNRMQQQKQQQFQLEQQQRQHQQHLASKPFLDGGFESEEEEEEEDAANEADFVSGEEDIVEDEYDEEEVNVELAASGSEGPYSSEEEASAAVSGGVDETMDEDVESPEVYSKVASAVAPESSRRQSMMRASLFRNDSTNHSRSSFGPSFGATSASTSRIGNLFQSGAPSSVHKRGLDSMMMDVEFSAAATAAAATASSSSTSGRLNLEQEFAASPVKVKKTFDTLLLSSVKKPTVSPSVPAVSVGPVVKSDEHVVPVTATPILKEVVIPLARGEGERKLPIPPLSESIVDGRGSHVVDAGLYMGRSFRVGWAPGGKYVVTGRVAGSDSYTKVKITSLPSFSWEAETDDCLRESLAQAERYRHVKSLDAVLAGTTVTASKPDTESSTSKHEANRTIIDESFQPVKSMLNTTAVVTPVAPLALIGKDFRFSTLATASVQANHDIPKSLWTPTASASVNDPRRAFTHVEISVWNLASALFDPVPLPSQEVQGLSERALAVIKESLQKDRVSTWLRDLTFVGHVSGDNADAIFSHLLNRRVAGAVQSALKNRDFRLATVLSQIGGVGATVGVSEGPSTWTASSTSFKPSGHGVVSRSSMAATVRDDIAKQVEIWTCQANESGVAANYMKIWRLLSGDVNAWDAAVVEGAVDWKQTFGLFLWYAGGGSFSLTEAVREYDLAWGSGSRLHGKAPVPWYLERRRGASGKLVSATNVKDVSYNLLKLHADSGYSLESAFLPLTIGPNLLDHRVSWLLWVVLSRAKGKREFAAYGEKVVIKKKPGVKNASSMDHDVIDEEDSDVVANILVSRTADACTTSLAGTLESLGLWIWALFVAGFLSTQNGRERLVKEVLARWFPVDDGSSSVSAKWRVTSTGNSELWTFVVSTLKVPAVWVHEAKALRAKYNGDAVQEAISLIDAQKYSAAHQIIVGLLSPIELINDSFGQIKNLLSEIPSNAQVEHWALGGGLILEYITILENIKGMLNNPATNKTVYNDVLAKVRELLKTLILAKGKSFWITGSLGSRMSLKAVEAIKKEWKVCFCEMAAKLVRIVHQIEQVLDINNQIPSDLLNGLPLSEDVRGKYVGAVMQRAWFGVKK